MQMDEKDPFLCILAAYAEAVRTKNVEAFAALYTQDVHVFACEVRGHCAAWKHGQTRRQVGFPRRGTSKS
jgi:ketosteroid isomerase-like protein